jgi:hypothetical protein
MWHDLQATFENRGEKSGLNSNLSQHTRNGGEKTDFQKWNLARQQ